MNGARGGNGSCAATAAPDPWAGALNAAHSLAGLGVDGARPEARGKFITRGGRTLFVRGVTYGTFRRGRDGTAFPEHGIVAADFAAMAANGVNSVRTYTVPPEELLDLAHDYGLSVLVGLPWEEHQAFLDERGLHARIAGRVRDAARGCAGHPAVLGFAIGNEIPSSIVRWYGARRMEQYLRRLHDVVKREDPRALVTYVNYPTTEYLDLPFLDFVSFNVYLESPAAFASYLARLQNLAGDRPLLLTECGLDSRRHGEAVQAESLAWQVRSAFAGGCAGVFVYAWTDEWCRGGHDIEDWDFGLTRRDRDPKPALPKVRSAFADVPIPAATAWPRISVLVCSYNGGRVIEDCLRALQRLEYPDYEVIVVSDGSTDNTAALARSYGARVITQDNQGLSAARNRAREAATGEIVAYLDDDAYPDPHWLSYLAHVFLTTQHAGVGGPNIAPPGDGPIACGVANAPGGPNVVLLSDTQAEHIPGCNMAFRRSCLEAVGGFDPRFRIAGDDVDLCWRLQERGWTLGYSPAAMVWHHRRNSVRAYWRQQLHYGRAESLLQRKWPAKYTTLGHATWTGHIYGAGQTLGLHVLRSRVYHGRAGGAPFQPLHRLAPSLVESMPLVPELHLLNLALAALAAMGLLWSPLAFALVPLALSLGVIVLQAGWSAARAIPASASLPARARAWLIVAWLRLLQPVARLKGRLSEGLAPWRLAAPAGYALPRPRRLAFWSGHAESAGERLDAIRAALLARGAAAAWGGATERCDLRLPGGLFGETRILMAIEDHGGGNRKELFFLWPHVVPAGWALMAALAALAFGAAGARSWLAAVLLGLAALIVLGRGLTECAAATALTLRALRRSAE